MGWRLRKFLIIGSCLCASLTLFLFFFIQTSPASATVVNPTLKQFSWAAIKTDLDSFVPASGILSETNLMALSIRTPVGFPFFRITFPPSIRVLTLASPISSAFWLDNAASIDTGREYWHVRKQGSGAWFWRHTPCQARDFGPSPCPISRWRPYFFSGDSHPFY